jgi:hypothetical protein
MKRPVMTSSTAEATAPLAALAPRRSVAIGGLGPRLPALLHALLVIAAATLWIDTLSAVDPRRIGDLGLVSALPLKAFLALGVVTVSFAVALRREQVSTPLALLHLGALVTMLYGATSVIDTVPRFNIVWRHAGVTDYVLSTGTVDPYIDAYFNWPGFFFLAALAARTAGLEGTLPLSNLAPVAFQLMYLPALVVISRAFSNDRRLAWWAVWIFYLTNWVGQDYFAPQALGYLFYLAVVAVVMSCLSRSAAPERARLRARGAQLLVLLHARRPGVALRETAIPPSCAPGQRSALVLICVVIIVATVASHQLTPWMMLAGLSALVGLKRCTARGLPVITLVLLVAWMTYLAATYLDGHLKPLLGQALDVQHAVASNVGGRLQGSEEHLLIVHLRLAMTGLLWLIALAGAVRGLRRGEASPSHAILALTPVAMLVLQPYGGEMLMRVYLFSLPFVSCYAACALMPSRRQQGAWTAAAVALAATLLLAGFMFTRYGNERMTLFTPGEVRTVERLYAIAPPGSALIAASQNLPWQQRHYSDYDFETLGGQLKIPGPTPGAGRLASHVANHMRGAAPARAYLVVTRSQKVYDELFGAASWGSAAALERAVERSPLFVKVVDERDGKVFTLRQALGERSG